MATNDYLERLANNGQITTIGQIVEDDTTLLSEGQLVQLINELDVDLINLRRMRQGDFASYSLSGAVGRSKSPAEAISVLMELREMYETRLKQKPTLAVTIYDSPDT